MYLWTKTIDYSMQPQKQPCHLLQRSAFSPLSDICLPRPPTIPSIPSQASSVQAHHPSTLLSQKPRPQPARCPATFLHPNVGARAQTLYKYTGKDAFKPGMVYPR